MTKNNKSHGISIWHCLLLWCIYSIIYVILTENSSTRIISGYMAFVGEVGFDALIFTLTFGLISKCEHVDKGILTLLCIGFAIEAINDFSYNAIVNILDILNYTGLSASVFDIPYILFLIFLSIVLVKVFLRNRPNLTLTWFVLYLVIAAVMVSFLFVFFFELSWPFSVLSLKGFYIGIETLLQAIGMFFAISTLFSTKNYDLKIILCAYLLFVINDIYVHFIVLKLILPQASFPKCVWVLALILFAFGFYRMIKKVSYSKNEYLVLS